MAVDVARDGPDEMGSHDPSPAVVDLPEHEHDPEVRQLVVGQPDRPAAQCRRRRRRASRRGSSPRARSRSTSPGPRLARRDPRCRWAGGRTARRRAGPSSRDGPVAAPEPRDRHAGPAELGRLWEPVERLGLAGELDEPDRRRQEREQRPQEGRLADALRLRRDDERDAPLEQQPDGRPPARCRACPSRMSATIERRRATAPPERTGRVRAGQTPVSSAQTSQSRRAVSGSRVDGGRVDLATLVEEPSRSIPANGRVDRERDDGLNGDRRIARERPDRPSKRRRRAAHEARPNEPGMDRVGRHLGPVQPTGELEGEQEVGRLGRAEGASASETVARSGGRRSRAWSSMAR